MNFDDKVLIKYVGNNYYAAVDSLRKVTGLTLEKASEYISYPDGFKLPRNQAETMVMLYYKFVEHNNRPDWIILIKEPIDIYPEAQ